MIPRETVDAIIETARIEDVVSDFITLKKRGTNLLGLCPFHGEKTPSFTVSAVKGIYKCFGCGKAGNTVNFIMEHLKLSYPEALKWLASKYGIAIEERVLTDAEKEQQQARESISVVLSFAKDFFKSFMHTDDEGRSIGLGYLTERGLDLELIERFELGYSPNNRRAFAQAALKQGFTINYIIESGMCLIPGLDTDTVITAEAAIDRFAGRVMFPVHDEAGRVVAFGGRILGNATKTAKYINSPESPVYKKSKILYGLFQGKKHIQQQDCCYLVEGYMDVISMHRSGIQNVVASSGTSLTAEQVKAIHRFTSTVIILYDGDDAGQKAAQRAIPMLLEEGMQVKQVLFPDAHDPDSYAHTHGEIAFRRYLEDAPQDVINSAAEQARALGSSDPVQKSLRVRALAQWISCIPDTITRTLYVQSCAITLDIAESVIQQEVNKLRRQQAGTQREMEQLQTQATVLPSPAEAQPAYTPGIAEELAMLRLMVLYGAQRIDTTAENEEGIEVPLNISLSEFILFELWQDDLQFMDAIHQELLEFLSMEAKHQRFPTSVALMQHANPHIASFIAECIILPHDLSDKWKTYGVEIQDEQLYLKKQAEHILYSYKEKRLQQIINEKQELLKTVSADDAELLLHEIHKLTVLKSEVNALMGRIITK